MFQTFDSLGSAVPRVDWTRDGPSAYYWTVYYGVLPEASLCKHFLVLSSPDPRPAARDGACMGVICSRSSSTEIQLRCGRQALQSFVSLATHLSASKVSTQRAFAIVHPCSSPATKATNRVRARSPNNKSRYTLLRTLSTFRSCAIHIA